MSSPTVVGGCLLTGGYGSVAGAAVGAFAVAPWSRAISHKPVGAENRNMASDQRDRRQRTDLALTVSSRTA